jgi:predicted 3-demethylubiquinone-9 3-methyltransferase (glyoxalase superfamily)
MSKVRIAPCLWFDDQAEHAAGFYVSVFKHSKVTGINRYPEAGREIHGRPPGSVMTVAFELDGEACVALNGGPVFKFNEAVSLQVLCDFQDEIDEYSAALSTGGGARVQQCGWLKDKFGLSWQVIPRKMTEWLSDHESPAANRVMNAMLRMKKLDIAALQRAYDGT